MDEDLILRGPIVERSDPIKLSLGEYLVGCIRNHGDRVALVSEVEGREVSLRFSEVLQFGMVVAATLTEHGVGVGDTVMLCCGNIVEFAPVLLGTLVVGAACSPVNPSSNQADFLHLLGVVGPKLVICDEESHSTVVQAVTSHSTPNSVVVISLTLLSQDFFARKEAEIPQFQPVHIEDLENHVAVVMTSSGTTGRPKGVEVSHATILYLLARLKFEINQVGMTLSGPYWASGMIMNLLFMQSTAKLVLLRHFTEKMFLDHVRKYEVNFTSIGSDNVVALAKWCTTESLAMPSLIILSSHGSRVPAAMMDLARKKLGRNITQSYGMTEMWTCLVPPFTRPDKVESVGKLAANLEAKVVDVETGKALGPNCEGELCFKSPGVLKGYRGNPEATKALFDHQGFLCTGDVGYYDDEGFFYVIDRIKDLIKYKLIQVPAIEIEEVLLEHPGILEAAVVGIPHDDDSEHSTAFVVKRPESQVTAEELVTLVQGKLSQPKWLHGGVVFVESLPRTPTGKVKKRELRTMFVAMEEMKQDGK